MTDTEVIQKFRDTGEPVRTNTSMPEFKTDPKICRCQSSRCVACDFDHDLIECSSCGNQWVTRCTFDDDMA